MASGSRPGVKTTRPTMRGIGSVTTPVLTATDYRAGGTNIIWKWNETDTSEFGAGIIPCSTNPTGITAETTNFRATDYSGGIGPRVEKTLTLGAASTSTYARLWPILDSSSTNITLPSRFRLSFRVASLALTNIASGGVGLGIWNGSTSTPYGVGILQSLASTATFVTRIQNSDASTATRPWRIMLSTGAGVSGVKTNINTSAGTAYTFVYDIVQGAGGNPVLPMATTESMSGYGMANQTPATTVVANRSSAGAAFLTDNGSIDSGWNNQVLQYLCLMFIGASGGAGGGQSLTFQMSDMLVTKHPMDQL